MSFLLQVRNNITASNRKKSVVFRVLLQFDNAVNKKCSFAERESSHYGHRENYIPFETVVQQRRKEARQSVIVQVQSTSSFGDLYKYCSGFGSVKGIHHYTLDDGRRHFMLVEFDIQEKANKLLTSGVSFANDADAIRVSSPLLWFRTLKTTESAKDGPRLGSKSSVDSSKLCTVDGLMQVPENALMLNIQKCSSICEQMNTLYRNTVLNDLETRLRYMVARQIEVAMSSLHRNATVWPFGSSVNGFGKMGCDLDLLFRMSDDTKQENSSNRLVYHTKKSTVTGRIQQQRYIELIADILQIYLPGCSHVRRILQARIPIVKYNQDYTGLECDLSISNMTGVYMSELLHLYGSLDTRVRPLVFAVRKWAESVGLTNASPGKWITNFSLTLMVMFFLQQKSRDGALLPSLNVLIGSARRKDIRVTEDAIHCTFLRDIQNFSVKNTNNDDPGFVLLQFFEFYCNFDFQAHSISINEGKPMRKVDHSALYIVNPLETSLNVSKNVSNEELERFKMEVKNAAWTLECEINKTDPVTTNPWGICLLFKPRTVKSISNLVKIGSAQRLVTMSDLFVNDDNEQNAKIQKKVHACEANITNE